MRSPAQIRLLFVVSAELGAIELARRAAPSGYVLPIPEEPKRLAAQGALEKKTEKSGSVDHSMPPSPGHEQVV